MTQPEALRLADELDHGVGTIDRVRHEAAAELRRLHEENETMLKALKTVVKEFSKHGRQHWPEAVKARAAIAKEENT